MKKPLVLIIFDGLGLRAASKANAIFAARKPNYDRLLAEYPNTLIHTSGTLGWLPDGQMGNSEVGHLNIGAGRVVYMDITKIDLMIEKGDFLFQSGSVGRNQSARRWRTPAPHLRTALRWRRALPPEPSLCVATHAKQTV